MGLGLASGCTGRLKPDFFLQLIFVESGYASKVGFNYMNNLPPQLQQFASFLDAQPGNIQVAFQYCIALLMVEAGKAKLVSTEPSENGAVCTFETIAGDIFSINRPVISEDEEAVLIEQLKVILEEDWF
jgi:hypothetical protein